MKIDGRDIAFMRTQAGGNGAFGFFERQVYNGGELILPLGRLISCTPR
jgi:hypothetical protein